MAKTEKTLRNYTFTDVEGVNVTVASVHIDRAMLTVQKLQQLGVLQRLEPTGQEEGPLAAITQPLNKH